MAGWNYGRGAFVVPEPGDGSEDRRWRHTIGSCGFGIVCTGDRRVEDTCEAHLRLLKSARSRRNGRSSASMDRKTVVAACWFVMRCFDGLRVVDELECLSCASGFVVARKGQAARCSS